MSGSAMSRKPAESLTVFIRKGTCVSTRKSVTHITRAPSFFPHGNEEAEVRSHHDAERRPGYDEATQMLHGEAEKGRTEAHPERRDGESEADGGPCAARPDELGEQGVLHAVPADAEEAEGHGERSQEPAAGAGTGPRHEEGAHRRARPRDDEHDAPPSLEVAVGEHAEDNAT